MAVSALSKPWFYKSNVNNKYQNRREPTYPFRHVFIPLFAGSEDVIDLGNDVDRGNSLVIGEMPSTGHGLMCKNLKLLWMLFRGFVQSFEI